MPRHITVEEARETGVSYSRPCSLPTESVEGLAEYISEEKRRHDQDLA